MDYRDILIEELGKSKDFYMRTVDLLLDRLDEAFDALSNARWLYDNGYSVNDIRNFGYDYTKDELEGDN